MESIADSARSAYALERASHPHFSREWAAWAAIRNVPQTASDAYTAQWFRAVWSAWHDEWQRIAEDLSQQQIREHLGAEAAQAQQSAVLQHRQEAREAAAGAR